MSCAATSGGKAWPSCCGEARDLCLRRRVRGPDRPAARRAGRPRQHACTACCTRSPLPTTQGGMKPFHETPKRGLPAGGRHLVLFADRAVATPCKDLLEPDASVVTISISTTRMASENYGYMAPIKAALDSSLAFLAKIVQPVFARALQRRRAGPAENLAPRPASPAMSIRTSTPSKLMLAQGKPCKPRKPPTSAAFLLSPRSSGINAQQLRRRRRHEHQLFRPRPGPPGDAAGVVAHCSASATESSPHTRRRSRRARDRPW